MSGVWARTGVACENTLLLQVWVSEGLCAATAPTNPAHRPQRQNSKPVPPDGATQNFPPLNQPLVDAAASGSVPAFPACVHESGGLPEMQVLF